MQLSLFEPKPLIISLWHPWAILWAAGKKQNETRHWPFPVKYRGQKLFIHAATKWDSSLRELCHEEPFCKALQAISSLLLDTPEIPGVKYQIVKAGNQRLKLPFGAIVGQCQLVQSVPTETLTQLTEDEEDFGDYSPGRFAWIAEQHQLVQPIPCIGRQGFWYGENI